jgi:hypothetical protein
MQNSGIRWKKGNVVRSWRHEQGRFSSGRGDGGYGAPQAPIIRSSLQLQKFRNRSPGSAELLQNRVDGGQRSSCPPPVPSRRERVLGSTDENVSSELLRVELHPAGVLHCWLLVEMLRVVRLHPR